MQRFGSALGLNVHATIRARANERDRLERLVKYLARPPIANDPLTELPDGRLALHLKQAWRDGTTHVVLSPRELLEKLIPLVPRPRAHVIRYHGILGPAAKDRAQVVSRPGPVALDRPKPVAAAEARAPTPVACPGSTASPGPCSSGASSSWTSLNAPSSAAGSRLSPP